MTWLLAAGALIAVAGIASVAVQVEDWGRDLSTNVARTSPEASDSLLRPLQSRAGIEQVAAAVRDAVSGLPRWRLAEEQRADSSLVLRCERRTRLFRFIDDVEVLIEQQGAVTIVSAVSRSRVGRGDLGQNPRNIRQLFSALRGNAVFEVE